MRGRRAALLLGPAAALALGLFIWRDYQAPGPLAAPATLIVPKGARITAIAELLGANGVVAHPWLFAAGAMVSGEAGALKAGEYEFPAAVSPSDAAALLAAGKVVQHRLTVPEGLTGAEVAALVIDAPALDGTLAGPPAEGSVLPDTYFYVRGDTRAALIARMQRAMARALAAAWAARQPGLPYADPAEALTLASIVEKETPQPAERARVAGVYVERLRLGMKLQADPTVVYPLTHGGAVPLTHPLDHADLAVESPYNTYLVKGLPPTPIDNPGLAALHAALAPEVNGDLYFVADGSGHHEFARTLEEHNRNIAALREKTQR